jgi:CDP-glycerol glycerophosphotransferase (TagB/SpsB family)
LDGISVWDALHEQFWFYFAFHFPRVKRYIETATEALNILNPSVVVVKADGPTPVRTMVNVANERSIPTVLVQHGLEKSISDYVPDSRHIAVWGEQSKTFFAAKGVSDNRLHVTGAPHFDYLQSFNCNERAIKADLGIPADDKVVMLASQVFADSVRRQLIDAAIESLNHLQNVSLILRPHPREDRELHLQAAESSPANVVVAPDVNIHDLLTTSDVLLAIRSTVILEACLIGTPVLLLTFTAEETNPFYSAENGFPEIDDPTDLAPRIESVLGSEGEVLREGQPSFGREFAHNADGKATDRIVNLIEQVKNR